MSRADHFLGLVVAAARPVDCSERDAALHELGDSDLAFLQALALVASAHRAELRDAIDHVWPETATL